MANQIETSSSTGLPVVTTPKSIKPGATYIKPKTKVSPVSKPGAKNKFEDTDFTSYVRELRDRDRAQKTAKALEEAQKAAMPPPIERSSWDKTFTPKAQVYWNETTKTYTPDAKQTPVYLLSSPKDPGIYQLVHGKSEADQRAKQDNLISAAAVFDEDMEQFFNTLDGTGNVTDTSKIVSRYAGDMSQQELTNTLRGAYVPVMKFDTNTLKGKSEAEVNSIIDSYTKQGFQLVQYGQMSKEAQIQADNIAGGGIDSEAQYGAFKKILPEEWWLTKAAMPMDANTRTVFTKNVRTGEYEATLLTKGFSKGLDLNNVPNSAMGVLFDVDSLRGPALYAAQTDPTTSLLKHVTVDLVLMGVNAITKLWDKNKHDAQTWSLWKKSVIKDWEDITFGEAAARRLENQIAHPVGLQNMQRVDVIEGKRVSASMFGTGINDTPEALTQSAADYRAMSAEALNRGDGALALEYTKQAIENDRKRGFAMAASDSAIEQAYATISVGAYESFTWDAMPEREEMFMDNLAASELQLGRPLVKEEIETIRNKYLDGSIEAAGDILSSPATYFGGVGVSDGLWAVVKKGLKETDAIALKPLLNLIPKKIRPSELELLKKTITGGAGATLTATAEEVSVTIGFHDFLELWGKKLSVRSAGLRLGQVATRIATFVADTSRFVTKNPSGADFVELVKNIAKHTDSADELAGAVKAKAIPAIPLAQQKMWMELRGVVDDADSIVKLASDARDDVFESVALQTKTKLETELISGAKPKSEVGKTITQKWVAWLANKNKGDAATWFEAKIKLRAQELMKEKPTRFADLAEATKWVKDDLLKTGNAIDYFRNAFFKEEISKEAANRAMLASKNAQKVAVQFGENVRKDWLSRNGQRLWKYSDITTDSFIGWLDRKHPGLLTEKIEGGASSVLNKNGKFLVGARNFYLGALQFIFTNVLSGRPGYLITNYIDSNFRAMVMGVKLNTNFTQVLEYFKRMREELPIELFQSLAKDMISDPDGIPAHVINGTYDVKSMHALNWGSLFAYHWSGEATKISEASKNYGKLLAKSPALGVAEQGRKKIAADIWRQIKRPFTTFYRTNTDFNTLTEIVVRTKTYYDYYQRGLAATQVAYLQKIAKFIPADKKDVFEALIGYANNSSARLTEAILNKDSSVLFSQHIPPVVQDFLNDMEPVQAANLAGGTLAGLENVMIATKGATHEIRRAKLMEVLESTAKQLEEESAIKYRFLKDMEENAVDNLTPANVTEEMSHILDGVDLPDEMIPDDALVALQKRIDAGEDIADDEILAALNREHVKVPKTTDPRAALKKAVEAPQKKLKPIKSITDKPEVPNVEKIMNDLSAGDDLERNGLVEFGLDKSEVAQAVEDSIREVRDSFNNAYGFRAQMTTEDLQFLYDGVMNNYAQTLSLKSQIHNFITNTPGVMNWPQMASGADREVAFGRFIRFKTNMNRAIANKFKAVNFAALTPHEKAQKFNLVQTLEDFNIKIKYNESTGMIDAIDFLDTGGELNAIHMNDPHLVQKFRDMIFGSYDHTMNDVALMAQNKVGLNLLDLQRDYGIGTMPAIRTNITGSEVRGDKGFLVWTGKDIPNLKEAVNSAMKMWTLPKAPSETQLYAAIRESAVKLQSSRAALVLSASGYEDMLDIFKGNTKELSELVAEAGNKLAKEGKPQVIKKAAQELRDNIKANILQSSTSKDAANLQFAMGRKMVQMQAILSGVSEDEWWVSHFAGITTKTVNTTPLLLMAENGELTMHLPIYNLLKDQLHTAKFKNGRALMKYIEEGNIRGLSLDDPNFAGVKDWLTENADKSIAGEDFLKVTQKNEVDSLRILSRVQGNTDTALEQMAKDYFGVTEDIHSTGYVLSDGTQLDLGATSKASRGGAMGAGGLVEDHGPVFLFTDEELAGDNQALLYMSRYSDHFRGSVMNKTGMMRINYDANTMEVASKISDKQRAMIAEWFSRRPEKGFIDVRLPDNKLIHFEFDNESTVSMRRIVDNINQLYDESQNVLYMATNDMPDWRTPPTKEALDELFSLDTFKEWDGGNVLRDAEGNVKLYHHGTSNYGFDTFDTQYIGRVNLYGRGFYNTESEELAKSYMTKGGGNAPGIYDVVIRTKNPLRINTMDGLDDFFTKLSDFLVGKERDEVETYMRNKLTQLDPNTTQATIDEAMSALWSKKNRLIEWNEKHVPPLDLNINEVFPDTARLSKDGITIPDKLHDYNFDRNLYNSVYVPVQFDVGYNINGNYSMSSNEFFVRVEDNLTGDDLLGYEINIKPDSPLYKAFHEQVLTDEEARIGAKEFKRILQQGVDFINQQGARTSKRVLTMHRNSFGDSEEMAMSKVFGPWFSNNLSSIARMMDYDSIIHTGGQVSGSNKLHEVVIALDGTNMKSVFNDGTFSETNLLLHMKDPKTVFGSTQFLRNGQALVQLSTTAKNPVSFVHELAHIILPDLNDADFDTLTTWAFSATKKNRMVDKKLSKLEFRELHHKIYILNQASDAEKHLYSQYQEAFANGWTKFYATEKDFPETLRKLYEKVAAALKKFYTEFIQGKSLDVQLSTEMRNMYRKLSGFDAETPISHITDEFYDGRKKMRRDASQTKFFSSYETYRNFFKDSLLSTGVTEDYANKLVDDLLKQSNVFDDASTIAESEHLIDKYFEKPAREKAKALLREGKEPISANAYSKGRKGITWVDANGKPGFTPLEEADYGVGQVGDPAIIDPVWEAIIANRDLKGYQLDLRTPETFLEGAKQMVRSWTDEGTENAKALADAWSSIISQVERDLNQLSEPLSGGYNWLDSADLKDMKEGMQSYVNIAQNDIKHIRTAQAMLIEWKKYLEDMLNKAEAGDTTAWFFQEHPDEWWNGLKEPADNIADEMGKRLDAIKYGGNYEGVALKGAVPETNRILIDYTTNYAWEYGARQVFPFWQFPSRSIPFWAETLVTHPEILHYYTKYLTSSYRARLQRGLVNSKGEPLDSYAGYVNIGNYWFNPMAPLSFRILMPSAYDTTTALDDSNADESVVWSVVRSVVETTKLRGISMNPVFTPLLKLAGLIDDKTLPRNSIIPQVDLVPRSIQRLILTALRKTVYPNAPEVWSPEVTYLDSLIEVTMYKDLLQQMNQLKADAKTEEEFKRKAYDLVSRAETLMKLPPIERKKDPLWIKYRDQYENGQYNRVLTGFMTGVYGKRFTDADAQYNALRDEISLYKSALNNTAQMEIYSLADNPIDMTKVYAEKRYDSPEGQLWNLTRTSSWVMDDEGNPLQGDARIEQIAKNLTISEAWENYYNSVEQVYKTRNERLAALPIGTPSKVKSEIYAQAEMELQKIDQNAPAAKDPTIFGKSAESLFKQFERRWWQSIASSEPYYEKGGPETYDEWKKRHDEWIADLPMIGDAIASSFTGAIRPQVDQMNFQNVMPSGSGMTADAQQQDFIKNLIEMLKKNTNEEGFTAYKRSSDTAYDALTEAWMQIYYLKYVEMTEDKTNEAFTLAEREFKKQYPNPPTFDDLYAWIKENYPANKFTMQELQDSWNGTEEAPLSVEERQAASRSELEQLRDQIFTVTSMIGPGNDYTNFLEIYKSPMVNGGKDDLNNLYDNFASLTKEQLNTILSKVVKAASIAGAKEPTNSELAMRAMARTENDEFKALVTKELGADFYNLQSWYYDLEYAEQKSAKTLYPELAKKLETYKSLKEYFASTHPNWNEYYGKTSSTSTGGGTGGTGTSTKTTRKVTTTSTPGYTSPWSYQKPKGMVVAPYRSTLDAKKLLGGELLGKGGIGGVPTWPNEMIRELEFNVWQAGWPDDIKSALGDQLTSALKQRYIWGTALSQPAVDFMNGLIERHPDWAPALKDIATAQ